MENCRRSLVHIGTYKRFPSKTFQPDEHVTRDMHLNLMAIVGFIFLGMILLHLFFGLAGNYAFYTYIAIFVILECTVIAVRFCIWLRENIRRRGSYYDEEIFVGEKEKISTQKSQSTNTNPILYTYDVSVDKKIQDEKKTSL